MANEATLRLRTDNPIDFIVADGAGIEKGTICKMTDPRTAVANDGTGDIFAGVAAREKIADDGRVRLALFRRGVFNMTSAVGGVITNGQWVATSGSNLIRTATEAEIAAGKAIGIALETFASNTSGEVMVGGF